MQASFSHMLPRQGSPQIIFRNDHIRVSLLVRLEQDGYSCATKFKRKQGRREQPGKTSQWGREVEGPSGYGWSYQLLFFSSKHFLHIKSKGKPQYGNLIKWYFINTDLFYFIFIIIFVKSVNYKSEDMWTNTNIRNRRLQLPSLP